ncbi:MAG: hypothetical protein QOF21_2853 [Actinomycetota bacterium]
MTVALVTGCSTGIGYATALRLARDGHHVVATMRTPDACDLAVVAKTEGLPVEVRALDVNDGDAVDAVVADALKAHGAVDVLVNNAGVGGSGHASEEEGVEGFRAVLETNLFGALRCTQAVLPSMRERGSGWIVNITSEAGQIVAPGMAPYCASKWALEAASEALAIEVASLGIRVAIIEPGTIMTPIWGKADLTPPTGAYAPVRNRLVAFIMADLAHASAASEVADCVAEAITTNPPRLRWLVGHGAQRNIAARAGLTDEEYVELWNQPDEEKFLRTFAGPDS